MEFDRNRFQACALNGASNGVESFVVSIGVF